MKKINKLAKVLGMLGVAAFALGLTTPALADSGRGRHGDDNDRDFRIRVERRFDNDRFDDDRDFRVRKEFRIDNSSRRFDDGHFDRKFHKFDRFDRFDHRFDDHRFDRD